MHGPHTKIARVLRRICSLDRDSQSGRELTRLLQKLGLTINQCRLPVRIIKSILNPRDLIKHFFWGKVLLREAPSHFSHLKLDDGYCQLELSEYEDTSIIELLTDLWRQRCHPTITTHDMIWQMERPAQSQNYPTLRNCFRLDDFVRHPEILDFILNNTFIHIATEAIGSLPKLAYASLSWSTSNELLESSQLYHLDLEDSRQVKIFLNILPVTPENGPLTFLPSMASRSICEALGDAAPGNRRQGQRVSDSMISQEVGSEEKHELIGPAGYTVAVNTGKCLHMGSRCTKGERLMLSIQFLPLNVFREPRHGIMLPQFPMERYNKDRYRTGILS